MPPAADGVRTKMRPYDLGWSGVVGTNVENIFNDDTETKMADTQRFPAREQVVSLLRNERPLPSDPLAERVVLWRTFRDPREALEFSHGVMLGKGQDLVGGVTEDNLGPLYWLGVRVDDIAKWGNSKAVQLTDGFDSAVPDVAGRPFTARREP